MTGSKAGRKAESLHTPKPWTARNRSGAGWQIEAALPRGFKLDSTGRGADGKTALVIWTTREIITIQIADERWVQFETGPWAEMQKANALLIAAAPELLAACMQAKKFLEPDLVEPGRTVFWNLVEAIRKAKGEL